MHRFPAPRTTLAVGSIVVLLLAADVGGAVAVQQRDQRRPPPGRPAGTKVPTGPTAPNATTTVTVPAAGQTVVTGRVTLLSATDAVAAPIPLPVTITVPERGRGDLTIVGVTVAGEPEQVVWLAGQPLPLSGTGSIDLGPAAVTADAGGITWHLDDGQRVLLPGRYTAGAPVAVGRGGLGEARDTVTFDAAPGAGAGFITNGDAQIRLAPGPLSLTGPGTVHLSGALTITTGEGPGRAVTTLTFGPGPFELTLRPDGPAYAVEARLQGNVTAA